MESFDGKKIKIRKISELDPKNAKKFQDFVNSLVAEDVKILINKRVTIKEEKEWVKEKIKKQKDKKEVALIAEHNNMIVANVSIRLDRWRKDHVGEFGISVRKEYRGIGLGKYLMGEIIELAKKELKPKPKIIRLSVFKNNRSAINLYEKMGFKKVVKIPKQIQYRGELIDELIMVLYL